MSREEKTQREVAELLGVSIVRVQQIEKAALRKFGEKMRIWRDHEPRRLGGLAAYANMFGDHSESDERRGHDGSQWNGWDPAWALDEDRIWAIYEREIQEKKESL